MLTVCYLPLSVLIILIRKIVGIPNFMHSGNTWATIFGLQFGNQSWSASYSILPDNVTQETEIWEYIKEYTVDDIKLHPLNIPESIFRNILNIANFGPFNYQIFLFLLAVFIFSLFYCYKKLILPTSVLFLVIFVFTTELFTYGLSYNSEPIRTMSTSLVLSCTLIMLPISAILRFHWLGARTTFDTAGSAHVRVSKTYVYPSVSLLLITIIFLSSSATDSPNLFSRTVGKNICAQKILLKDYPSKFVQQQNLNQIVGKHGEWWIDSVKALNRGSFLLITSIDANEKTHDSSVYLERNSVGGLRNMDIICVKKSSNLELGQLGFQEGLVLSAGRLSTLR